MNPQVRKVTLFINVPFYPLATELSDSRWQRATANVGDAQSATYV